MLLELTPVVVAIGLAHLHSKETMVVMEQINLHIIVVAVAAALVLLEQIAQLARLLEMAGTEQHHLLVVHQSPMLVAVAAADIQYQMCMELVEQVVVAQEEILELLEQPILVVAAVDRQLVVLLEQMAVAA